METDVDTRTHTQEAICFYHIRCCQPRSTRSRPCTQLYSSHTSPANPKPSRPIHVPTSLCFSTTPAVDPVDAIFPRTLTWIYVGFYWRTAWPRWFRTSYRHPRRPRPMAPPTPAAMAAATALLEAKEVELIPRMISFARRLRFPTDHL